MITMKVLAIPSSKRKSLTASRAPRVVLLHKPATATSPSRRANPPPSKVAGSSSCRPMGVPRASWATLMMGVSLLLDGRPILMRTAPASVRKLLSLVKTRLGHLSTSPDSWGSSSRMAPTSRTSTPASRRASIIALWSSLNLSTSTGWSKWCTAGSLLASSSSLPGWWTRTLLSAPLSEVIPYDGIRGTSMTLSIIMFQRDSGLFMAYLLGLVR